MSTDSEAPCRYCGNQPWTTRLEEEVEEVFLPGMPDPIQLGPRQVQTPCCDDHWFAEYGDMLTPNELRGLSLADADHQRSQAEWLVQYERAGIEPDQDPSMFTLSVPVVAGETGEDFMQRVLSSTVEAWQVRHASPDDFGQEPPAA